MRLKAAYGRAAYFSLYPVIWLYLNGTTRVYAALELASGEVILAKNLYCQQKWRLPGGGVKKGENLKDAVSREVFEELGIKIDSHKYSQVAKGEVDNYSFVVFRAKLPKNYNIKLDNFEMLDAQVLVPGELAQTSLHPILLSYLDSKN